MEDFEPYEPPRAKGVHIDPRTKVLFMFFLATLIFFVEEQSMLNMVIVLIPISLLFLNRQYRPALIYGGLFALAAAVKLSNTAGSFPYLAAMLWGLLSELIFRFFPVFMFGYYIIESTKPNEFIAAVSRWHVPDALIIPISVVFRFIPTLGEENRSISSAMRMREIGFGTPRFWRNPAMMLEYRLIPLMMSIAKIGEELSAAALTRGLGGLKKRTCLVELHFGIYDAGIAVIAAALLVCTVLRIGG